MTFIKKHKIYYLVLVVICGFGIFLLLQKSLSHQTREVIAILLAFFYTTWGILHHITSHTATLKIVLEYSLVGTVGFLLINLLLQSA